MKMIAHLSINVVVVCLFIKHFFLLNLRYHLCTRNMHFVCFMFTFLITHIMQRITHFTHLDRCMHQYNQSTLGQDQAHFLEQEKLRFPCCSVPPQPWVIADALPVAQQVSQTVFAPVCRFYSFTRLQTRDAACSLSLVLP